MPLCLFCLFGCALSRHPCVAFRFRENGSATTQPLSRQKKTRKVERGEERVERRRRAINHNYRSHTVQTRTDGRTDSVAFQSHKRGWRGRCLAQLLPTFPPRSSFRDKGPYFRAVGTIMLLHYGHRGPARFSSMQFRNNVSVAEEAL